MVDRFPGLDRVLRVGTVRTPRRHCRSAGPHGFRDGVSQCVRIRRLGAGPTRFLATPRGLRARRMVGSRPSLPLIDPMRRLPSGAFRSPPLPIPWRYHSVPRDLPPPHRFVYPITTMSYEFTDENRISRPDTRCYGLSCQGSWPTIGETPPHRAHKAS